MTEYHTTRSCRDVEQFSQFLLSKVTWSLIYFGIVWKAFLFLLFFIASEYVCLFLLFFVWSLMFQITVYLSIRHLLDRLVEITVGHLLRQFNGIS